MRDAGGCASTASRRGRRRCPPYITEPLEDAERYQTVYARERGSAAAPTAGLHFTPELLARLDVERVTLHVGLDTFRPLQSEIVEEHRIHGERYEVATEAWERIRAPIGCSPSARRPCACSRRSRAGGPLAGRTELFITPGFEFRRVDHLLTNFHLPRSTLLALVMAFAGVEEVRRLYAARDRGALPLLLLRRCDADPVTCARVSHFRHPRLATSHGLATTSVLCGSRARAASADVGEAVDEIVALS